MKGKTTSKKAHTATSRTLPKSGVFHASIFGMTTGLICGMLLLLICSLICLFSQDPNKLISPLSVVCGILTYFIAGFAASKKKAAAIPCGALSGVMISIVFFIISFLLNDSLSSSISFPVEMLIRTSFIVVSILGALLGVNSTPKRKKRR